MSGSPLPPLPSIGPAETRYRPAGTGMLELLGEQHASLTRLAARLSAGQRVGSVLVATASRHLCAEEQYLFPAVRATLPDGADLAERELAAVRGLRAALERLGARPERAAPAAVREALNLIAAHVRRADLLFPRLRRDLDEPTQVRLGNRVQIALEAAPSRPHPGLPDRPPLNKVVDPLVGAVDKVRDALTRRVTYPEDL